MIEITGSKVACTPLFDPTRYGSLYLPDSSGDRADQGIIKYVGPDVETARIGDHVLFSGYTGTLLDLEGEGLIIILPEEFIVATISYEGKDVAATNIPGLYFKSREGEYFTATYEQALNFITEGLREARWYQELKQNVHIRDPKIFRQAPKKEDYDRLR